MENTEPANAVRESASDYWRRVDKGRKKKKTSVQIGGKPIMPCPNCKGEMKGYPDTWCCPVCGCKMQDCFISYPPQEGRKNILYAK